jgi:hypothetical protein
VAETTVKMPLSCGFRRGGKVISGKVKRRLALTEFKHINKHVFVRMGKKCTPASGSSTLPRRTVPYSQVE